MKKTVFILTLLLALGLYSQELPRIVPPSPNAASLGVFGEVPVGPYNGTANVSIPIYEVKSGSLSVPITLNYHTSGIRVSQDASWAGLGWALNAGGVITRAVIGKEDFLGNPGPGYIDSPPIPFQEPEHYLILNPDPNHPNLPGNVHTYVRNCLPDPQYENDVQPPLYDSYPDKFTFNFGGYSGSMMFGKDQADNNALKPTLFKQNDLDITYYRNEKKWIVKDERGNTYHFETKENSVPYSYKGGSQYDESKERWLKRDYDGGITHTNSWYLSYIISPNNDRIDFEYDTDIQSSKSVVSLSEYKENQIHTNNGCLSVNTQPNCYFNSSSDYGASMTVTDDIYLKKIAAANCTVDFYTSDRNDIERYDASLAKAQKLDSIVINNNNNQKVHSRYEFVHNVTHTKNDRLVLNELRQVTDNDIKIHKFTYNSTPLPSKMSYQIDWWGFYNGATANRKLISDLSLVQYAGNGSYIDRVNRYPGANRKPNSDFAQAQILTEVEYPTKGSTKFVYESNDYSNFQPYQDVVEADDYINLGGISTSKSDTITFSEDVFLKINLESERETPSNGNCYYVYNSPRGKLEKLNPDLTVDTNTPVEYFWPNDINTDTTSESCDAYMYSYYKDEILLSPGTYRLTAYIPTTELETENVVLSYSSISRGGPIISTKKGGGIRIKDVINYDSDGDVLSKKTYDYTFEDENEVTKSSGILMSYIGQNLLLSNFPTDSPNYHGNDFEFNVIQNDYQDQSLYNILIRLSRSYIPMSFSANGNLVGYSKVTETNIDRLNNSSNGKIVHHFENKKDYSEGPQVIPNTPSIPNLNNGNPKRIEYYNDSDILIQEDFFYYATDYLEWIPGVNVYQAKNFPWLIRTISSGGIHSSELVPKIGLNLYEYPSIRSYLSRKITTMYDTNGQNPISTSSKYFHGSSKHLQVTGTKTTVSDGKTIETKTLYPDDIKTASTLEDDSVINGGRLDTPVFNAVDRMKQDDLHQIAMPIQVETTVKDGAAIVSQTVQRTNYSEPFTNIILPKKVQTLKGPYDATNNPLEDRINYHSYDTHGNPVEVSKADGSHIYYIWGYKDQYPIAKIENFTASQASAIQSLITAAETASDLDNDRTMNYLGKEGDVREALDHIRNHASLSNTLITSYTYDPLIGVTSMTDPQGYTIYYHYDSFNRLKYIKDADGNLVSENKYNYKS